MSNVLIVTGDTLGAAMAGPAIRALEMAKALSKVSNVTLATTVPTNFTHEGFDVVDATDSNLRRLVNWSDIIVFQGALLSTHPWIAKTDKIIVADVYDPMHLENLEQQKNAPKGIRFVETLDLIAVMNEQVARADFLLCASEKQRDFWLGQMAAVGRLNPLTYDRDTSLRTLIDVVPFGVQETPPVQKKHGIRGVIPGIGMNDKVVLWGGGIYNWFDPLTLIRAIGQISKHHPDIKLVFMGTQHPNPHVPEMKMSFEARELSKKLGLDGKYVFFNEGWVPYDQRADFLLDADLGVSTHLDHLETAFSFRTRILDYLWAGLPIVATNGDTFEAIIESNGLGKTVAPGDVAALAKALEDVLYSEETFGLVQERVTEYSKRMRWNIALKPLVDFVVTSQRSADQNSGFVQGISTMAYVGRRTFRQRLFMYSLSVKHNGFKYSTDLFLKNLFGKSYRKLKKILKLS
ncbi:glycosyltransferase [Aurantimicrobium minutum]|uniref:glycosyltransferase n=1 Tax=Aurantimicrobium minutum TaxID=708131 RepID=UPI00247503EE|nr:glycosyltransferase [Aurantimicrobium minutum]MDH6255398.1 glycosyltransferase involved in cell wall biosynthesis [Aurantimicrobium minutum]